MGFGDYAASHQIPKSLLEWRMTHKLLLLARLLIGVLLGTLPIWPLGVSLSTVYASGSSNYSGTTPVNGSSLIGPILVDGTSIENVTTLTSFPSTTNWSWQIELDYLDAFGNFQDQYFSPVIPRTTHTFDTGVLSAPSNTAKVDIQIYEEFTGSPGSAPGMGFTGTLTWTTLPTATPTPTGTTTPTPTPTITPTPTNTPTPTPTFTPTPIPTCGTVYYPVTSLHYEVWTCANFFIPAGSNNAASVTVTVPSSIYSTWDYTNPDGYRGKPLEYVGGTYSTYKTGTTTQDVGFIWFSGTSSPICNSVGCGGSVNINDTTLGPDCTFDFGGTCTDNGFDINGDFDSYPQTFTITIKSSHGSGCGASCSDVTVTGLTLWLVPQQVLATPTPTPTATSIGTPTITPTPTTKPVQDAPFINAVDDLNGNFSNGLQTINDGFANIAPPVATAIAEIQPPVAPDPQYQSCQGIADAIFDPGKCFLFLFIPTISLNDAIAVHKSDGSSVTPDVALQSKIGFSDFHALSDFETCASHPCITDWMSGSEWDFDLYSLHAVITPDSMIVVWLRTFVSLGIVAILSFITVKLVRSLLP